MLFYFNKSSYFCNVLQIMMAGLYIHIPFCKSRCIYCGFYSTVNMELRQHYVDAVCQEMEMRPSLTASRRKERLETIYLGGGTPSQLTVHQIRQLFLQIEKVYQTPLPWGDDKSEMEVTIECNPDDITPSYAESLSQLPVNRVSMGVQTFNDSRLQFLHRRHNASQVPTAVRLLRNAGIRNISIDLMYGFPDETLDDWRRDVEEALALDVEHISAYCLMIEEGTVLYEQMRNKKSGMNNEGEKEELERSMYELLIDRLTAAGYEHYEISNFTRPGFRSRHNSSYWRDFPYIGLGAAAHSYNIESRQWNVSDIMLYMEAIERGELPLEQEISDDDTHYNDRITTALRTSDGLDLSTLSEKYRTYCMKEARRFLDDGLLRQDGQRLILTRKGIFVSDFIMSALICV